jgi:Na+/H+ antiporter NhaA
MAYSFFTSGLEARREFTRENYLILKKLYFPYLVPLAKVTTPAGIYFLQLWYTNTIGNRCGN